MKKNKGKIKKSKSAYIIESKCDKSPFCPSKRVCPTKAIVREGFFMGRVFVNEENCIGCGKCIQVCPHNAITFK